MSLDPEGNAFQQWAVQAPAPAAGAQVTENVEEQVGYDIPSIPEDAVVLFQHPDGATEVGLDPSMLPPKPARPLGRRHLNALERQIQEETVAALDALRRQQAELYREHVLKKRKVVFLALIVVDFLFFLGSMLYQVIEYGHLNSAHTSGGIVVGGDGAVSWWLDPSALTVEEMTFSMVIDLIGIIAGLQDRPHIMSVFLVMHLVATVIVCLHGFSIFPLFRLLQLVAAHLLRKAQHHYQKLVTDGGDPQRDVYLLMGVREMGRIIISFFGILCGAGDASVRPDARATAAGAAAPGDGAAAGGGGAGGGNAAAAADTEVELRSIRWNGGSGGGGAPGAGEGQRRSASGAAGQPQQMQQQWQQAQLPPVASAAAAGGPQQPQRVQLGVRGAYAPAPYLPVPYSGSTGTLPMPAAALLQPAAAQGQLQPLQPALPAGYQYITVPVPVHALQRLGSTRVAAGGGSGGAAGDAGDDTLEGGSGVDEEAAALPPVDPRVISAAIQAAIRETQRLRQRAQGRMAARSRSGRSSQTHHGHQQQHAANAAMQQPQQPGSMQDEEPAAESGGAAASIRAAVGAAAHGLSHLLAMHRDSEDHSDEEEADLDAAATTGRATGTPAVPVVTTTTMSAAAVAAAALPAAALALDGPGMNASAGATARAASPLLPEAPLQPLPPSQRPAAVLEDCTHPAQGGMLALPLPPQAATQAGFRHDAAMGTSSASPQPLQAPLRQHDAPEPPKRVQQPQLLPPPQPPLLPQREPASLQGTQLQHGDVVPASARASAVLDQQGMNQRQQQLPTAAPGPGPGPSIASGPTLHMAHSMHARQQQGQQQHSQWPSQQPPAVLAAGAFAPNAAAAMADGRRSSSSGRSLGSSSKSLKGRHRAAVPAHALAPAPVAATASLDVPPGMQPASSGMLVQQQQQQQRQLTQHLPPQGAPHRISSGPAAGPQAMLQDRASPGGLLRRRQELRQQLEALQQRRAALALASRQQQPRAVAAAAPPAAAQHVSLPGPGLHQHPAARSTVAASAPVASPAAATDAVAAAPAYRPPGPPAVAATAAPPGMAQSRARQPAQAQAMADLLASAYAVPSAALTAATRSAQSAGATAPAHARQQPASAAAAARQGHLVLPAAGGGGSAATAALSPAPAAAAAGTLRATSQAAPSTFSAGPPARRTRAEDILMQLSPERW